MAVADKIKMLPDSPGVYIMRDLDNHILYIGKARNLKNRVKQYFGSPKNKTTKVLIMVSKIADFEYIITRNEIEALVLENNLIKLHKPPYNILLKDDKNYPFIRINLKEKFPKVEIVRKLKKDGAKYYGPYMQGISTKDIFELIYSAFNLRSCSLKMDKIPKSQRPCLNYHIGRCAAPCTGNITSEDYNAIVQEVTKFLSGNDKSIANILKQRMEQASDTMDFELAIYYRDRLKILDNLVRKQVTALANDMDIDLFAIADDGINRVIAMLFVRGGKLVGGDKTIVNDGNIEIIDTLSSYIFAYYDGLPMVTPEIITNYNIDENGELSRYLSDKYKSRINIVMPIQGVRKQLLDMADNNATDYLTKCVGEQARLDNMTIGAITQLKDILELSKVPYRMECYDISHISGSNIVSSMTVFSNGVANKKMYRKFKITHGEGNNDFLSMQETLRRRLREYKEGKDVSFSERPDLIVIDGGKGQYSYAQEALAESGLAIDMIAIAERDEEIYTSATGNPVILPKNSHALMVLQRLRDEAHRFAVAYHQSLRQKQQTSSKLLEIDGIGAARVKALYKQFKTLAAIKAVDADTLSKVEGMTRPAAEAVWNYFHNEENQEVDK